MKPNKDGRKFQVSNYLSFYFCGCHSAKAGIQNSIKSRSWIPTFAGMTKKQSTLWLRLRRPVLLLSRIR